MEEVSDQQFFIMETIRKIVFQHYHKNNKRRKHAFQQPDFCNNGKKERRKTTSSVTFVPLICT